MGLFNSKKIILDEAEMNEALKSIGLDRLDFENKKKIIDMGEDNYMKLYFEPSEYHLLTFIHHEQLMILRQPLDQKDKLDKLIEQNNESKEMNQKLIEQNNKIIELLTKISEK